MDRKLHVKYTTSINHSLNICLWNETVHSTTVKRIELYSPHSPTPALHLSARPETNRKQRLQLQHTHKPRFTLGFHLDMNTTGSNHFWSDFMWRVSDLMTASITHYISMILHVYSTIIGGILLLPNILFKLIEKFTNKKKPIMMIT